GVHGRVPELGGVHLAETLEARDLNALLGEVEGGRPELSKRLDLARLLSERDRERRLPDYPAHLFVGLAKALVRRRCEEALRDVDVVRRARRALGHFQAEAVLDAARDLLELVAVRRELGERGACLVEIRD